MDNLKSRLDALAEFLPIFEATDFEFGHFVDESGKLSYYSFSDDAYRFIEICYAAKWVNRSFDWVTWKGSVEALQLRDDPAILDASTADQLERLLTILVRQDRFVTGTLAVAFESGFLVRILRRAAMLAEALELQGADEGD